MNHLPNYTLLIWLISNVTSFSGGIHFKNWHTFQKLNQFSQHWSSDYLLELQQHHCSHRSSPNPHAGDVILLKENNTAPAHGPIAIITDVYPGSDGIIWVITFQTSWGTFRRTLTKICPLPLATTKFNLASWELEVGYGSSLNLCSNSYSAIDNAARQVLCHPGELLQCQTLSGCEWLDLVCKHVTT